ncbi:unnamed protein product [Linum trigynum]|uniref:Uncharacterized protein n=1 Tax=Linum trigynum TaxID=586398 RepID=A0AAV2FUW6_9ROSI
MSVELLPIVEPSLFKSIASIFYASLIMVDSSHSLFFHISGLESSLLPLVKPKQACPYSKFSHLTANQTILQATERATKIHIVNFVVNFGSSRDSMGSSLESSCFGVFWSFYLH